jgi:hypothetical protein
MYSRGKTGANKTGSFEDRELLENPEKVKPA